jgi:DNA-binding NarL/FixJ family response regulator
VAKSILVVDDNPSIRRGVRQVLEQERDIVVCGEAVDGRDAIDKAMDLHPDLIIIDLAMPNMNGLQAAEILHQIMPAVPLILFSMHAGSVLGSEVQTAGIAAVVPKDEGGDVLLIQAKALLGLSTFPNPK